MKKSEQFEQNNTVVAMLESLNRRSFYTVDNKQIRCCSANVVVEMDNLTGECIPFLYSYGTCIAAIVDGVCYDFLRYVYGYTSTSAHHIAKFCCDYHATKKLTYKPL